MDNSNNNKTRICVNCLKDAEHLQTCSKCMIAKYCGRELHKNLCRDSSSEDNLEELGGKARQGNYQKAEKLFEKLLRKLRYKYGEKETEETLGTLRDLASCLHAQGFYQKAEVLYVECLEKRREMYGVNHIYVLRVMESLGILYSAQERHSEAEKLLKSSLEIMKEIYGPEHPNILESMQNLGSVYYRQGLYESAEELFEEVVKVRSSSEKMIRRYENDPRTYTTINNLATTKANLGKKEEACALFIDCLNKQKSLLGENHADVFETMQNIAGHYYDDGQYLEAEALFKDLLDKQKKVLGVNNENTRITMFTYACTLEELGKKTLADALFKEAEEIKKILR